MWCHSDISSSCLVQLQCYPTSSYFKCLSSWIRTLIIAGFYLYSVPTEYENNTTEFAFTWTGSDTFTLRKKQTIVALRGLVETLMCTEGQWISVLCWERQESHLRATRFKNWTFLCDRILSFPFQFPMQCVKAGRCGRVSLRLQGWMSLKRPDNLLQSLCQSLTQLP